jgi:hypothetical protein
MARQNPDAMPVTAMFFPRQRCFGQIIIECLKHMPPARIPIKPGRDEQSDPLLRCLILNGIDIASLTGCDLN